MLAGILYVTLNDGAFETPISTYDLVEINWQSGEELQYGWWRWAYWYWWKYLFKVNNRNSRTRCEICLKLMIKTRERRHSRYYCYKSVSVFIANFGHIWHIYLVLLLLLWPKNVIWVSSWTICPCLAYFWGHTSGWEDTTGYHQLKSSQIHG